MAESSLASPSGTLALPQDARERLTRLLAQPAVRRSLPALTGIAALTGAGLLYLALASGPQRILYASLTDGERAEVVQTLEKGGIAYVIDNGTGTLTVAEDDLYRARMLVAADGGLAAPESASEMLDAIPLGSSRTLEGERLRLARERELTLTIAEIDGIEAVRVHLATPERSVFVRENSAPSASVMLRLARGRTLGKEQVEAIVNLVAGSVPGLAGDAVRVVDQHGRLLSSQGDRALEELNLQRELEGKLQGQLAQLLAPLLGEDNFSSEVQVQLDRQEVTAARESYEKEGALRSESESASQRAGAAPAGGVPGATSNTPPPPGQMVAGAPQDGTAAATPSGSDSETSARRVYELGREVAVTSTRPGGIARVSVAVAVSKDALKKIAPANEARLKALVEAAVGADPQRGDEVTVIVGKFEPTQLEAPAFYETGWFAAILRNLAAVVMVLLVLLLGVRPLLNMLRARRDGAAPGDDGALPDEAGEAEGALPPRLTPGGDDGHLREQVELARRIALDQPERAVAALQRMLAAPPQDDER